MQLRLEFDPYNCPVQPHQADQCEEQQNQISSLGRLQPSAEHSEQRREDEATQGTEHADHSAHCTDIVGEVVGNVFVNGTFTDSHGTSDHEHQQRKADHTGVEPVIGQADQSQGARS